MDDTKNTEQLAEELEKVRIRRVTQQDIIPGAVKQRHLEANLIFSGLAADLPNGSTGQQAYFATDTNILYVWNGTAWVDLYTPPAPVVVPTDGWTSSSDTWVYASASTFTIVGADRTAIYTKGTRLKFTNTTLKYAVVVSSAFTTDTTVTIAVNTDYTIANAAITSPYYSYQVNPQGYPGWFAYTPTFAGSGSLTYTSVTVTHARFSVTGKTTTVTYKVTGTTGGTTSDTLYVTAPVTPLTALTNENVSSGSGYAIDGGGSLGTITFPAGPGIANKKYDSANWGLGASRTITSTSIYEF